MALADEVTDLLAVDNEVDAVGGQHQEAVICVVQLQQRHRVSLRGKGTAHTFLHTCKALFFFWGCCVLSCKIFPEAEDFREDMIALQLSP